ncbi:hypothetical protein [Anaerobacterium chartisolvens]|uniref:hypothetical protein n=1 Tax=Anaerobacterium chartisolvens TaxID=1297424 RepID=UPI0014728F9E|nr:hypothetical protein [Anaerobacterium chartisolvens]
MELNDYPVIVREILCELIKRKAVTELSIGDKMLINYLCTQKLDRDYIPSLQHLQKTA